MNIDEELQSALDVAPSPAFVARVRTRIASEPAPRRWTAWWFVPAAALAVAAVALAFVVPRPARVASERPLLASRSLLSTGAPPIRTAARTLPTAEVHAALSLLTAEASSAVRDRDRRRSNVLVDRAESQALQRLVFGPPLNIGTPYVGTTLGAIEIAPISIEPLPIGSEGVRQ